MRIVGSMFQVAPRVCLLREAAWVSIGQDGLFALCALFAVPARKLTLRASALFSRPQ